MTLEAIHMEGPEAAVSDQVARLIDACSRGWERFFADNDDDQAPSFVPSEPERVYAVLEEVTRRHLPPNRVFCEWGSGFGVVTCMAALLGYQAYGIEIEADLAQQARAIARRLRIPATMICASMFPKGYGPRVGADGVELARPASSRNVHDGDGEPLRYDGMDIDIDEIGLFFVYPWAVERDLIRELFDAVAVAGAILVLYHTELDIRVFRKVV
jgi:hypothetical protein